MEILQHSKERVQVKIGEYIGRIPNNALLDYVKNGIL